MKTWRLVDTGLFPAAQNIALNRAMLEARAADEIPNTLRFLRFEPCALLGYHQCASLELDLDYCRRENLVIQRRITGGGAIWFDPAQLGWELYLHRRDLPAQGYAEITRLICETAASAIARLGVAAHFRPRNDIEVEGRKISGTGGACEGQALLYQGTLLLDFDAERMVRVLRLPAEKLADKAVASLRERIVSLVELLGRVPPVEDLRQLLAEAFAGAFGVKLQQGGLAAAEMARYETALGEIESDGWINLVQPPPAGSGTGVALIRRPGGLLRAAVSQERGGARIKQVWFMGDFFAEPRRIIMDLEAALKDVSREDLGRRIREFFSRHPAQVLSLAPEDFIDAAELALAEAGT